MPVHCPSALLSALRLCLSVAVFPSVLYWSALVEGLQLEYPVFVDVEDFSLTSLGRAELTSLVQYAMDLFFEQ